MKLETPEQETMYLKQDNQRLHSLIKKLETRITAYNENTQINLNNITEKLGITVLVKRPCDTCLGAGHIVGILPWVDPRASKDCTRGGNNPPSTPCNDCDMTGIVWK